MSTIKEQCISNHSRLILRTPSYYDILNYCYKMAQYVDTENQIVIERYAFLRKVGVSYPTFMRYAELIDGAILQYNGEHGGNRKSKGRNNSMPTIGIFPIEHWDETILGACKEVFGELEQQDPFGDNENDN